MEGPLIRALKRLYRAALKSALRLRWGTLTVTAATSLLIASTIPYLGEQLMPKFRETDFLMHWVEKPGIGIDAMNRITLRASDEMMKVNGVLNFGSHIGRATVVDEVVGPNFTELWISIDDAKDYDATVAAVQEIVDGYPGLYRDLLTYLTERIKEVLTGTSASIVVRVYGPDMERLRSTAGEIEAVIKPIEGVTTLKVEPQVLVPQIAIDMKVDAANQFGLTPGLLMQNVTTLINGLQVGEMYRDQAIFPVVVVGKKNLCTDLATLGQLMIDTPSGAQVPLASLADRGIMLISHYRQLAVEEPELGKHEFIVRGAEERLAPILMTALTTGLALVPLVVTGERPGQEIEYPMALVILTGLAGATLINLLVLPVLVSWLNQSTMRSGGNVC